MARHLNNFFVGTSSFISVTGDQIKDLEEFTVSFWFKPIEMDQGYSTFIEFVNETNTSWNMHISIGKVSYFFRVKKSTTNASIFGKWAPVNPIPIGVWYHMTFLYKNGYIPDIYLNNVSMYSTALNKTAGVGSMLLTDGVLRVGNVLYSGSTHINAYLSELGYWNRRLDADEIAALSSTSEPISPILISDGLVGLWRLHESGGSVSEPDYINNQRGTISGTLPAIANPYYFSTREDDIISLKTLGPANPSWDRGKILGQKIDLLTPKTISKISLYLNVVDDEKSDYIQEEDGIASWAAINFQTISSEHAWMLFDTVWEYVEGDDVTVNQGFLTNSEISSYDTPEDAYISAGKVSYSIYLGEGTYKFAIRGYGTGSIWYTWDDDSQLDSFSFSTENIWHEIGSLDIEEAGIHTLNVYLGNISASQGVKIDQFILLRTDVTNYDIDGQYITHPLTKSPFSTYTRLRRLINGEFSSVGPASTIGWGWLSSSIIKSNDWHNYDINDASFMDGLSLEYIVISGNERFNPQLNFTPTDPPGSTWTSADYGNTFIDEDGHHTTTAFSSSSSSSSKSSSSSSKSSSSSSKSSSSSSKSSSSSSSKSSSSSSKSSSSSSSKSSSSSSKSSSSSSSKSSSSSSKSSSSSSSKSSSSSSKSSSSSSSKSSSSSSKSSSSSSSKSSSSSSKSSSSSSSKSSSSSSKSSSSSSSKSSSSSSSAAEETTELDIKGTPGPRRTGLR